MKKLLLLFTLVIGITAAANAQVAVNVNIGTRPVVVEHPVVVERPVVYEYYYIPEANAYYDVRRANYIYYTNRKWSHASHLPVRYKYYETYHNNRIVINDYHGPSPYLYHKAHKAKYNKVYYKSKGQKHFHNGNNGKGHGNPHKGKNHNKH